MKMKKSAAVILSVSMAGMMIFTGCGTGKAGENRADTGQSKDSAQSDNTGSGTGADAQDTTGGYVFAAGSTQIAIGAEMSGIEAALGEPEDKQEMPACAGEGITTQYNYSDFQIHTNTKDGKELVWSIILNNENASTPEGIGLSDSKEDIVSAYGSDYKEDCGIITYQKDGVRLMFIMDKDAVLTIQYDAYSL